MSTMCEFHTRPPGGLRLSGGVAAAVVALHLMAVAWALLPHPPAMAPTEKVLMVTMITASEQKLLPHSTSRIEKIPPVLASMHRVESASVAPVLSPESRATPVAEAASPSAIGAVTEPAPPAPAVITPLNVRAAYANNPYPAYPSSSRKMGEQGVSSLRVLVSPEGRVQQIELERSSGYARLDAAAMTTVRAWKFAPARQGNSAVAAWVVVPVNWKLEK